MRRLAVALIVAGLASEALYLRIARLGDLQRHVEAFLAYGGVAFLLYLGVVGLVYRSRQHHPPANRWCLVGIALGAVAFRLTLFGLPPTLSGDIHRYLWDGRVQAAGINPYRYAPNDEALRWLRDDSWRLINHPDIPTIYPALTELAFHVGVRLSPTLAMQKALFLGCDLLLVVLLIIWLPRWGVNPLMSVVYAWHPLVIVEIAASGHNDPLGVVWLLIGLALWQARSRIVGTMALGMAFLAKFTTALLWPFYWVRARARLLLFAGVIAIGSLSSWCSPHFTSGMGHYARPWEFNSSAYQLLASWSGNPFLVRVLSGLILAVTGWWLAKRGDDLPWYTLRMLQAAVLLTPVLEPWYLVWLIPLLCIRPSWMWLVFSGLVMLSYLVLVGYVREGRWQIPAWVTCVEYVPLYGWLMFSGLRSTVGRYHDGLCRMVDRSLWMTRTRPFRCHVNPKPTIANLKSCVQSFKRP